MRPMHFLLLPCHVPQSTQSICPTRTRIFMHFFIVGYNPVSSTVRGLCLMLSKYFLRNDWTQSLGRRFLPPAPFLSRWEGGLPLRGQGTNPNIPEGRSSWLGNWKDSELGWDLCQPRGQRSCETLHIVMYWIYVWKPIVQHLSPSSDKN